MPSHDPSRPRRRIRGVKRRKKVSPSATASAGFTGATYNDGTEVSHGLLLVEGASPRLMGGLKDLAPLVWYDDYEMLFELEQHALEQNNNMMSAATLFKILPLSEPSRLHPQPQPRRQRDPQPQPQPHPQPRRQRVLGSVQVAAGATPAGRLDVRARLVAHCALCSRRETEHTHTEL